MSALTVLKYKSYRNYTIGRFVLMCGQWLHRMAVGWLVWDITHSTVWLGAFAIIEALVALFVTPIAGIVADRYDPIKALKISQSLYFLFALMLAFLVVNDLITLTLLMPLFVVMAAVPAISQPISMAIVSRLVPHGDELAKAVGLNAVVLHASRFIGPAIGGVIVAKLGMKFLFSVALMPTLFFVITLFFVTLEYGGMAKKSSLGLIAQIREGGKYAISHPVIGPLLGLGLCNAFFLMAYFEMMPGISDLFFNAGATGLASLLSASGLGGFFGSLAITMRGRVAGLADWVFIATALTAVALVIVSVGQSLTVGLISVFVMSALAVTTATSNQIMIQISVDQEYRGRVMSLMALSVRMAPAVGGFTVGILAPIIGMRYALAAFGVCALLICAWLSRDREKVAANVKLLSN